MKKVSFYTFGCRLNQAETSVLKQSFSKYGYSIVPYGDPSDTVIVNTCTVTEFGDNDTRRLCQKISKQSPETRIALVGCQAQVQKEKLQKLPGVSWVVGNERKMDLAQIISSTESAIVVDEMSSGSFTMPSCGEDPDHTRANLKVQEGCNFFCSFCVIPFTRGRARSRDYLDTISEAKSLVRSGHKEIVITGINIGTYLDQSKTVLDLMKEIADIDGLERLRISSIEPTTIDHSFLDLMAEHPKICNYLHLPIQSASDRVLKNMRRKYTFNDFKDYVVLAKEKMPDICIGSDVIVGFPGESLECFNETKERLANLEISYFHVFSYSGREKTQSLDFDEPVDRFEIKRRSKVMRELSSRLRQSYMKRFCEQSHSVLFEEVRNGYWRGLTSNYIRVLVPEKSTAGNLDLKNQIRGVVLEKPHNQIIFGRLDI